MTKKAPATITNGNNLDAQLVSLADIKADGDFNARTDLGELTDLATSMRTTGLLQPICIKTQRKGSAVPYTLVAGFRRYAAAQELGWTEISAIVSVMTNKEAMATNMVENVRRRNLNLVDEARGAARLVKAKMSKAEIKARLGWTATKLTQSLAVLSLSDKLQEALRGDRITIRQAEAIHKLPVELHVKFIGRAEFLKVAQLKKEVENLLKGDSDKGSGDADEGGKDDGDKATVDIKAHTERLRLTLGDILATIVLDADGSKGVCVSAYQAVARVDFSALAADDLVLLSESLAKFSDAMDIEGSYDTISAAADDSQEGEDTDADE